MYNNDENISFIIYKRLKKQQQQLSNDCFQRVIFRTCCYVMGKKISLKHFS